MKRVMVKEKGEKCTLFSSLLLLVVAVVLTGGW